MNNFFRALIAGYGAKKLGGGCFGTILVFILIWVALGQCSFSSREVPPPQTYPSKHRVHAPIKSQHHRVVFLQSFEECGDFQLPAMNIANNLSTSADEPFALVA
jgi:hypothetical protein